jgi:hypothetical protein
VRGTERGPRTLAAARKYRYHAWAGNTAGRPYREGDCVVEVFPNERGALHRQCCSHLVKGTPFCAVHQPGAQEARAAKRPPTRFEREMAALDQKKGDLRYLRRCERALKAIAADPCICLPSHDCLHALAKKALRR